MDQLKASMDTLLRLKKNWIRIMLNLKWDVSVQDYFKDLQIMTVFGTVFILMKQCK